MSLAQFADAHFAYPGNELLTGASLLIRPGDRLALVGPNGTGKSTALRLLAGDLRPDSGDVRVLGKGSVAYLRQSQELGGQGTILEALLEPFAHLQAMHDELTRIEAHLASAPAAELQRYGELQDRYTREGGYDIESRVRRLTVDVGFSEEDLGRSVDTLSGGERGRLELAKVLVRQPDLLLMDEPTNHLDLQAIERLESYLAEYPGAFVMVSHDRAFIQRTCREIVELEGGKFVRYPYPYDRYVVERDLRLERARVEYERQKEHVDKTEDFIRRNLAGQKTKQAQSRRKMLEKLERLERPEDHWQLAGKIALTFSTGGELGAKEIIRAPGITVGYPGKPILRDLTVNIYRGDRVGIVGPNGSGKSTLLRTLVGDLPPLGGEVQRGSGVRLGYFDQKLSSLSEDHTLLEEIQSVRADLSPEVIRQYLARFRFFDDDPFRVVKGLSGGERSRLALAKMMLFPRNVLALDEPTNHLDIPARETLEGALDEYPGTLMVVSHDRYFLDRVCRKLLVVDEQGRLESHLGNWSEFRSRHKAAAREATKESVKTKEALKEVARDAARDGGRSGGKGAAKEVGASKGAGKPAQEAPHPAPVAGEAARTLSRDRERQRRKLERKVETLEAEVARLEGELAAVRAELAADHQGDWQKLHALADRERELDELLARRMAEWESAAAALAQAPP
jgi:ATP-binding cassette subfamily F protein 3